MKRYADKKAENLGNSLFDFAEYDPNAAESRGTASYSYWGSTFRVFLKNKSAVFFLFVLLAILLFTFIQPLLPNQYKANDINKNPDTDLQFINQPPSSTTVLITAPAGTTLMARSVEGSEGWYAVTNVLTTIQKRTVFTVTEYGEDFCQVEFDGMVGYVKNDFTTKLKLPEDFENTPYECKSNFPVDFYSTPADFSNEGTALYVRAGEVEYDEATGLATTLAETGLRIMPSDKPFLFGTNNIGQDLWARVWGGTRTSLFIGFAVALTEAFLGILMGVLWGYVRSLDRFLTEVYNVIDNIPTTIVLILISYILKPSVSTLILAMCLTGWLGMARFIRNQIVIIRDRDFNLASRCLGTGTARIIVKNLLPYLVSVIMLRMALSIPGAIGSEVFITYIGLGLSVNTPSLGNLINEGRKLVTSASLRYQLLFPAIVLSIVTTSFYIIGNAFADAADPRNHVM